jgi:hypothetical protein
MMQATGPPESAAVRRARLGVLLLSLLWALTAVANPSTAEAAEPPRALTADSKGVLEIITVPKLPGARFMVDGRTHRADSQGVVRLKVKSLDRHKVAIVDKKISQTDRDLQFDRWYQRNHDKDHLDELSGLVVKRNLRIKAAYRATYKLQYSFVDKARNPVDRTRVSRVEFRGDHGQTVSGNGSGSLTVLGIRPIVTGGTIIAKRVNYTVQRVDVDGSNVVQVNEQRFEPSRKTTVVIPLQLHSVHFSTRDMLFGNPVGQAVWLKYPDGHRFKVPLDADGKATVENLARGRYTVQVDAPGLAFERPLVVSRNQYVELQHVSNLDIAVAACAVAALMLILYLVRVRGRPVILRSARFGPSRIWAATQRIPRVKIPAQPLARQEMAHPRAADPPAVGETQLPDDARKAALSQVGKLEQSSDQSLESSKIRTWRDTILDLQSGTKTRDSIDIQGAREVDPAAADTENLHTDQVDRAAADTKMIDGEKVGPALTGEIAWPLPPWAADTEKVDPAAADTKMVDGEKVDPALTDEIAWPLPPWDVDTEMVDVLVQNPAEKRRFGSLPLAATALAALLMGALLFGTSRDHGATAQSVPTVTANATATVSKPTSASSDESSDKGGEQSTIQLQHLPHAARPFQAVRIRGAYHTGADTFLRVQRSEKGKWLALPLPTETDRSGQFTTHVEFGQPGRYQLRVLDPDSGVTSKPFVLVVEG